MGYLQGWIEAMVKEQITITNNIVKVIRYEDVCQAPNEQFKTLFNFAGIDYSIDIVQKIKISQSRKDNVAAGDFSLTRNSAKLAQIKIPPDQCDGYCQLMNAYEKAFSDFKQSRKVESTSAKNITTSYSQDSSLVELC
jgi:hypothetical protein